MEKPTEVVCPPQPLDMQQVARLNTNLGERMFTEGVTCAYIEDADILLITIGQPKPSLSEHVGYDIYYEVEPRSLQIVGFTIMNFVRRVLENNEFARVTFGDDFQRMRERGGVATMQGEDAKRFSALFQSLPVGAR